MNARLVGNGYRISALIDAIVTSPQFLNRRDAGTRSATALAERRRKGAN